MVCGRGAEPWNQPHKQMYAGAFLGHSGRRYISVLAVTRLHVRHLVALLSSLIDLEGVIMLDLVRGKARCRLCCEEEKLKSNFVTISKM